jgi:hypothetical protein
MVAFAGAGAGQTSPQVLGEQQAFLTYQYGSECACYEAESKSKHTYQYVIACSRLGGYGYTDSGATLVTEFESSMFRFDLHCCFSITSLCEM